MLQQSVVKELKTSEFDFDLPEALIALRPAVPRDSARMLVVGADGEIVHSGIRDLPAFLRGGDTLVFNDTRVISARLRGWRTARLGDPGHEPGPKIEVTLHKRLSSDRYRAFARPGRKLAIGDRVKLGRTIVAEVVARGDGGEVELRFAAAEVPLERQIADEGELPLPPYIASRRRTDRRDSQDYQTILAREARSVAAPTAGLHFTHELLAALQSRGINHTTVTLHVGAGTFLPVRTCDTNEHKMHSEYAELSSETALELNRARVRGGRIVAVGTTSLRTLESAADERGILRPFSAETDIFITPGYRFKAVDILLTNFHMPRSTLFMLVCAFCGLDRMRAVYAEAIRENYRFFSYGDACLLFRPAA
jgi:S-adenosylmethionine:tRNA ribosyltransferase-isomerase